MPVDVRRHFDVGVSHPLLHVLEREAAVEQQTRAAMPQLMEPNMRQLMPFQKLREVP